MDDYEIDYCNEHTIIKLKIGLEFILLVNLAHFNGFAQAKTGL